MNWYIDVVLQSTGDSLFTIELPSIPGEGFFITYTPLSGPVVLYKVEKSEILVSEVLSIDPAPINPAPPSTNYAARVQLSVSVLP